VHFVRVLGVNFRTVVKGGWEAILLLVVGVDLGVMRQDLVVDLRGEFG
jgi:hypothetical protein